MTIQRITVDHGVLPDAMLDEMKAHLRVKHVRDDMLIKNYTAAAIGMIERKCNVSLDPATYVCTGDELVRSAMSPIPLRLRSPTAPTWSKTSYTLPLNNVSKATVNDDAEPPVDHSADFTVWNPDFGGNGGSFLVPAANVLGPVNANWLVELEVGLLDPDDLAPAFFALVARMTGSFYENREASAALWAETWDAELMGLWRPTV